MNNGFSLPEVEQASLSAMLQWEECRNEAAANLKPEHYSEDRHRLMFNSILEQWRDGKEIDLVLFTQLLREKGHLEAVGGPWYITTTWTGCCHSPVVMTHYIDLLLEQYEKRTCAKACLEAVELASTPDEAITVLSEIPVHRTKEVPLKTAMLEKLDRMESGEPDEDVIKTGLIELDKKSPLRKGDMPLIVGQRKSGKSILALSIVENVAARGVPVLYFSLEDRVPKVIDRLFAGVSRIPMGSHHVKRMVEVQLTKATIAVDKIASMPITIRDNVFDLSAICGVARDAHARGKAEVIVVDYAQLVRARETKERRLEIEKVSRDFRLLAMELEVPLILLCQLNKDGETRETKALEMDATAAWEVIEDETNQGKRLLKIPWQRNGESDIAFPVTFLGSLARIEDFIHA